MESSIVRILVVEDSDLFQGLTTSVLRERSNWQVVGIVADGLEAVRVASQLKPDLILLDIGLPKMDGVRAARQIRVIAPECKIVFLSQESSAGVVREAFKLGARGYVVKAYAKRELVAAIESVLRNGLFIGSGVMDDYAGDLSGSCITDRAPKHVFAPSVLRWTGIELTHEVHFYSASEVHLQRATRFIQTAITSGYSVLICATGTSRGDIREALQSRQLDVDDLAERGNYISLDAAEMVSTFMVEGAPDPVRFSGLFGGLIRVAAEAGRSDLPGVAVYSECASLLCAEGKRDAAIRVEQLWNELARIHNIDILCGYSQNHFHDDDDIPFIKGLCAAHSRVYSE